MAWRAMRFGIGLATSALGCATAVGDPGPLPVGGRHVLFVGNSLTYANDLPATVAAIAAAAGDTIRVRMAAGPNLALIDHLNGASDAVSAIRGGTWDVVVLQQGPTPAGICRDSLVLWTTMFDREIAAAGARTAVLMTWPSASDQTWFDQVRVSFEEAARAVDGIFLPAGEAWRAAWALDRTVALYGPDGFHPSTIGTFLTALVVYERISGRDVRTLAPRAFADGRELSLPEATVRLLQRAAHETNARFPAEPGPGRSSLGRPSSPPGAVASHC